MTIAQIEYFMAVADYKNFSKAAEKLYITQPALSRQIAAMEEELGFDLFVRSRPLQLTPAGEVLHMGLVGMTDRFHESVRKASVLGNGAGGIVTIGVLPGVDIGDFFPKFLFRLQKKYPEIEIGAEVHSYAGLVDGLNRHDLDAAIAYDFILDSRLEEVDKIQIDERPSCIVIPKSHPLAGRDHYKLADFKDEKFILNAPNDLGNGWDRLLGKCKEAGFVPRYRIAENLDQYMLLTESGMGVSVLNGRSTLLHHPGLEFIPLKEIGLNRLYLIWPKSNRNPSLKKSLPIFRAVLEEMRDSGEMEAEEMGFMNELKHSEQKD